MATKSIHKVRNVWGFSPDSLLQKTQITKTGTAPRARVQVKLDNKGQFATRTVEGAAQIEIFLNPRAVVEVETDAKLKTPLAVKVRDLVGASLGQLERLEVEDAHYDFYLEAELLNAALMGLEIALYRFKRIFKGESPKIKLYVTNKGQAVREAAVKVACAPGVAVNLARHLVNLPPNLLNPVTYAEAAQKLFVGLPNTVVEVWDEKRLAKEKMGLHLAVGQASSTPPRLVHIRYRPKGASGKAPLALVGKGITFDSGGLDIKPASGMRLMKKDMGGSAAVLGVACWAAVTQPKTALDFYLAIAENSVGGNAFRPSDIVIARNGQSVEIHNTDAEGRLVLADAMDVAITQDPPPRAVIDVATLTGAIKVALGSGLAGLFANDARLAQKLASDGLQSGDVVWPMPLMQKYRSQLNSTFADQVNSADGFGGAITAALFLEKFAGDVPWAHLDIYAWKDSAEGAWLESGGNGQSVLGLIQFCSTENNK